MNEWSKELAEDRFEENLSFLKHVQRVPVEFEIVKQSHEQVFEKTDCLACANCCKTSPPIVTRSDAKRIGKVLGISPKQVIRKYLIDDVDGSMMMNGIPCTFLQDDNTCQIYENRPEACRRYPHTDEKEYTNRPMLNAKNTIVCPAAYSILELIKDKMDYA